MTTRIQLIVTGDLEELSLHHSLRGAFSDVDVEFLVPQRTQDFTSNRLSAYPKSSSTPPRAAKLAAALVAAVHPGRRGGPPPDLVVAVDDLELVNQDQPAHVVDYFARAVRDHVEGSFSADPVRQRVFADLAERASFHLLAPMVETYFFGEAAALVRAGADKVPSRFNASDHDVEDFEVDDPPYAAAASIDTKNPRRHPKRYVRFLCDPLGTVSRPYRETTQGVAALDTLDWPQVLGKAAFARFARSMFQDIEDALVLAPTRFPGHDEPVTRRKGGGLLRNVAWPS
jgi:hypothetical protein